MRVATLCAAVLAATALGAAPAAARESWRPGVGAAAAWAAERTGTVAFAVRTDERLAGRDVDEPFPSASVVKAMLMVTYLRQPAVRDRPLRAADRALLAPMIRRSDNRTATRIRDLVGDDAVTRLARHAGMTRFEMDPVWGYSRITARDQTRLFLRIDRLVPRRHRAYAMRLLRTVVPAQRWGIGEVAPAGWDLYFKGGWGAGTGAVDHQVALLRRGRHRVAIAVLTTGSPSHRYGKATLEGVFARLTAGLEPILEGEAAPAGAGLPG